MRQRLLHIDILAGGAGIHSHRHVPVVRAADEHGVHILVVEQLLMFLGGDGVRSGELAALLQPHIVDVAHGRDADAWDLNQRPHQRLAAAAGADAADVDRLVRAQGADGRRCEGGHARRGATR